MCGNHVDQFLGEVHVGVFQRAGLDQAGGAGTRRTHQRRAGIEGLGPAGITQLAQALRVVEGGNGDLPQGARLTVGETRGDDAGVADIDTAQASGRESVLYQCVDTERTAVLGGIVIIDTHGQRCRTTSGRKGHAGRAAACDSARVIKRNGLPAWYACVHLCPVDILEGIPGIVRGLAEIHGTEVW